MPPQELVQTGASLLILIGAIGLGVFVFWLWAVIDCATNDYLRDNDKLVWILVVIFLNWLGAIIYFFVARKSVARYKYGPRDHDDF